MSLRILSLALLSGLRIQHCCELWRMLQVRLRPCGAVAGAVTGGCSSDLPPSLGTSTRQRCNPKKKKKKKKKKGLLEWGGTEDLALQGLKEEALMQESCEASPKWEWRCLVLPRWEE